MDYIMLAIGLVAGFLIFKRCAQLLPPDRVRSSSPRLKRGFILFFVTVVITAGFFLCVDIIITAIAKNFIIASQGHLPGVTRVDFYALFPDFDTVVAQAFIFAHFIPITQYCMLAFGPLFLFLLTMNWSIKARKARVAGTCGTQVERATSIGQRELKNANLLLVEGLEDVRVNHLKFLSRILRLDERKGMNLVKVLSLNIVLWVVIPLVMTQLATLNPLHLDPNLVVNWNFVYFLSLPSEIILGAYLAYFSVNQLFQTPPPRVPTTTGEKPKKRSSKLVKVLYVSFLIYDFGLMWVILFNYTPETIRSGSSLIALLLQVVIPAENPLRIISIIFVLFPIDTLLILLLQLLLFFRNFFQTELPAAKKKSPSDLWFLAFIISGYAIGFTVSFIADFPWMYTSYFSGTLTEYQEALVLSQVYYPKVMIGVILGFITLVLLVIRRRKRLLKGTT